jgi:hypothetical protein
MRIVLCLNDWVTLGKLDQEDSSELEEEQPPQPNIEGSRLWRDIEGHFHSNRWKSDELMEGRPVTRDNLETLFS